MASRIVEQLKNRHRPVPCATQGPSEVFRIVKVIRGISASQLSARNRFLLHCHPVSGVSSAAATPKLTMIAGAGNFPSGSSRCESFLYNPTIADENAEPRRHKGRRMRRRPINRGSKNIL